MPKFKVLIQHFGDKQYWRGDSRTMNATDAQPLINMGVLEGDADDDAAAAAPAMTTPEDTGDAPHPLDHDGNGRKGGSRKRSARKG